MWKCSKCGAELEDNETSCPQCGEECPNGEVSEDCDEVLPEEVAETAEAVGEASETENSDNVVTFDEPEKWICENCQEECCEDMCPICGQPKPEDEAVLDFAPKKKSKIYGFVIAVTAIVLVTVAIFVYFFTNRCVNKTGETITYQDIENSIDCIVGDKVALKINGIEVPRTVFETVLASHAISYQQELCTDQTTGEIDISKLDGFKWTDIADEKTKETHKEKVLAQAVTYCNEMYSVISMGKKFDIEPSQVALEEIDKKIDEQKETYGDDFERLLKLSGYKNVDQYKEGLVVYAKHQAVIDDIEANPDKYIGKDTSIYNGDNISTVTLKPIMIYFSEEDGTTKEDAKKKAEEVVKFAKEGKDFDKLIDEYDESNDSSSEPLTITKGSLVGQFPDIKEFETFEEQAFKLDINQVSNPIEMPHGFFVLKRVSSIYDAIAYTTDNSKILANKSLFDDLKITASFKALYEESE